MAVRLSTLCTEQLAKLCVFNYLDEQNVVKYLSSSQQKLWFILCIHGNPFRIGVERYRTAKLLSDDWNLLVALLKLRDKESRLHLHRIFQEIFTLHHTITHNLILRLESFTTTHSVKEIYEILLFATFLQEAGWFGISERLMRRVLDKMDYVYVENTLPPNCSRIKYFGPMNPFGPSKNKKNVYSALLEVKLNLLKCFLLQPTGVNLQRTEDMILEMQFDQHLLSNLKQEDQIAIKVIFLTLCSSYHYAQSEYHESLKHAREAIQLLINYGFCREELINNPRVPINGVKIQPRITIDCLRQMSKALLATGDHETAEKLMELAMNMNKMEWNGKHVHDIYFAILLQDYGELLQSRQKWKKSHNCFTLAVDVKKKKKKVLLN